MAICYDDGILDFGSRVKVNSPGRLMHGEKGTVIAFEDDGVNVRFDRVTKEMEGYEDARTGVLHFTEYEELVPLNAGE